MSSASSPVLFSQVSDISSYVSLPVLEGMQVEEVVEEKNYDDTEKEIVYTLLKNAGELKKVSEECTVSMDFTISQKGKFVERKKNYLVGIGNRTLDPDIEEKLIGMKPGDSADLGKVEEFLKYKNKEVYVKVNAVYNIEYPITDDYMQKNTEYSSLDDMVRGTINKDKQQNRTQRREKTMGELLDRVLEKTTFVSIPDSLIEEELKVLDKDGEKHTFKEAEQSLKKVFLIEAVNEKYKLVSAAEMEKRAKDVIESSNAEYSEYEKQRLQYLECEEDVVNFLYKTIDIVEKEESAADEDGGIDLSDAQIVE
jgi:uncharacterized protein (UPF0216 family)